MSGVWGATDGASRDEGVVLCEMKWLGGTNRSGTEKTGVV